MKAQLFTRDANGLQAWPDDRTKIEIQAKAKVEVIQDRFTGDNAIAVFGPTLADDLALYIPRGGSVVIEAAE